MVNPLRTVGLVRKWNPLEPGSPSPFLGSCFSYRWQNRLITAAHCVKTVDPSLIAVDPTPNRGFLIGGGNEVEIHPTADIAIIKTGGLQLADDPIFSFHGSHDSRYWGEDVAAFGFPADVLGP